MQSDAKLSKIQVLFTAMIKFHSTLARTAVSLTHGNQQFLRLTLCFENTGKIFLKI